MEKERAKAILDNDLIFDRTYKCDWCSRRLPVAVCNYGTSHYNRLICYECAEDIDLKSKQLFGHEAHWYSEEKINEAKETLK